MSLLSSILHGVWMEMFTVLFMPPSLIPGTICVSVYTGMVEQIWEQKNILLFKNLFF